jgi:hypothetical protein
MIVAIVALKLGAAAAAGGHKPQSRPVDDDVLDSEHVARLACRPTQMGWELDSTRALWLLVTR